MPKKSEIRISKFETIPNVQKSNGPNILLKADITNFSLEH